MRSHFLLACCFINNKGKRTLFLCVLLCVGHETRDKVSYLLTLVLRTWLAMAQFLKLYIDSKINLGTYICIMTFYTYYIK